MKKFIFFLSLFCFHLGYTQAPSNIIGKSIKIQNLEIAEHDFKNRMNWDEATKACAILGNGWRLPTKDELNFIYQNQSKIGKFTIYYYWTSLESDDGYGAWFQGFVLGTQAYTKKSTKYYARAVRSY